MGKNEKINIVLATNKRYLRYSVVAIFSILDKSVDPRKIVIHLLLTQKISPHDIKRLYQITDKFNSTLKTIEMKSDLLEGLPVYSYYRKDVYSRIYFADMFPRIDRFIYLDSDLILCDSIEKLWKDNLSGNIIGAIEFESLRNVYSKKIGGQSFFSSGVLLVDAKKYRKENIAQKIDKYLRKNKGKLIFADQDALNFVLKSKWKKISSKWNVDAANYNDGQEISIIHFIGSQIRKPLHPLCASEKKELYYYYLQQTGWKSIFQTYIVRKLLFIIGTPIKTSCMYLKSVLGVFGIYSDKLTNQC